MAVDILRVGTSIVSVGTGVAYAASANPAPTDISLSASSIAYNASSGTVVGTLSVVAPAATSWSFAITNGNTKFALSAGSGATVQLLRGLSGSLTTGVSENVQITVTDGASNTYQETFSITVVDPAAATEVWQVGIRDDLAAGARTNVPFLFRIPLSTGGRSVDTATVAASGNTVTATVSGSPQAVQISSRAVAQGGQLAGVTVAGVLATLGSGATKTLTLSTQAGSDETGTAITWADVLATSWNRTVEAVVGGTTYTANPRTAATSDTTYSASAPHYRGTFMSGPYCTAFVLSVPFANGGSRPSDFVRVHYHIYAFKAGSGAVSGGNPIIGILTDIVIDNCAWDPTSWGDVSISTLRVKNEAATTLDTWSSVTAYALAASDLDREYWWSPDGTNRGGWTALHQVDASDRLIKFQDNGWMVPQPLPKMSGTISTYAADSALTSDVPFARQGLHMYAQGAGGSREDIALIHKVEQFSIYCWTDTARTLVRKNASAALSIPWRFRDQLTGLAVDPRGARAAESSYYDVTTPSPKATPYTIEAGAHQPLDGYLLWNTSGRFKWLECVQFGAIYDWCHRPYGSGFNKCIVSLDQARGQAWFIRTLTIALACTPNDLSESMTGWSRAMFQSWLDASMGTAGGQISWGSYHGAKNQYWGTDGGAGKPLSGWFDNSDPQDGRYFFHENGPSASAWMTPFWTVAMAHADRLNVLNSDGRAMADWTYEALPRMMDTRMSLVMVELYQHIWLSNIAGTRYLPKRWDQRCFDNNADTAPSTHSINAPQFPARAMRPLPSSIVINASNPAAVTITLNGSGVVPWFDDGEQNVGGTKGDWFKGAGRWNMRGTGGQWIWWRGRSGQGRITAVGSDGLSCTVDTTVTDGVNFVTGTYSALTWEDTLILPWPGPASTWGDFNSFIIDENNDYSATWFGGLSICKMMVPARTNISTYAAAAKARALLRTSGGLIHSPAQDGDAGNWFYFEKV